jgi:hypothetical protein
MTPNIFERSKGDYPLFFRQRLDDEVYRLPSAGGHFELRERDGSWRVVELSEQDFECLLEIPEHEAVAASEAETSHEHRAT